MSLLSEISSGAARFQASRQESLTTLLETQESNEALKREVAFLKQRNSALEEEVELLSIS